MIRLQLFFSKHLSIDLNSLSSFFPTLNKASIKRLVHMSLCTYCFRFLWVRFLGMKLLDRIIGVYLVLTGIARLLFKKKKKNVMIHVSASIIETVFFSTSLPKVDSRCSCSFQCLLFSRWAKMIWQKIHIKDFV